MVRLQMLQQGETFKELYDGDFVIIDEQLHAQFDEFKQKDVPANHSMVRKLNLIDHYLSTKGVSNCVELSGKLYVMLNSAQMDYFCHWIYDSRENDGDIFYLGKCMVFCNLNIILL